MSTTSDVRETFYGYEEVGKTPVITLKAEMAKFPLGQVEEAGNQIIERLSILKPSNLVVDLTELDYMGSAMVALIVRLWKQIKDQRGHRMVVAVDGEYVLEVLQLARLTEHWTIVGSRDEACKELGLRTTASTPGSTGAAVDSSNETEAATSSPILMILAAVSGVASVCGAVLVTKPTLVEPTVAVAVTGIASVVGLAVGTLLVLSPEKSRKTFGGVALGLCGLAIILALALYPS